MCAGIMELLRRDKIRIVCCGLEWDLCVFDATYGSLDLIFDLVLAENQFKMHLRIKLGLISPILKFKALQTLKVVELTIDFLN